MNKCHWQVLCVEAAIVVFAACVVFTVAWTRTLSQPRRAQAFLADFTSLELGKSTMEQAQSLARKHGGIPWFISTDSMQCSYQRCAFHFVFENRPLTTTHLVPYTELVADVSVEQGIVVARELHYARHNKRPLTYDVVEAIPPALGTVDEKSWKRTHSGIMRLNVDLDGIPSTILVGLQPSSPTDQKKRAYSLDLSCLARIFGCNGLTSYVPPGVPFQGGPYQSLIEEW